MAAMHLQAEQLHVADQDAGQERAQIAAAVERLEPEIPRGDGQQRGDSRRLAPHADPLAGHGEGEYQADQDAGGGALGQRAQEVGDLAAVTRRRPYGHDTGHGQRRGSRRWGRSRPTRRSRSVPARRAMRSREKRGIRIAGSVGASTAPISSAASAGRPNARPAATAVTAAVITTPGPTSSPRPTPTVAQHAQRQPQPAEEQDEGHPDGEDQIGADRVHGDVDPVQPVGSQRHPERHHQHDLGQPHELRQQSRQEAGGQDQCERLDDVLGRHVRRLIERGRT